MIVKIRFCKKKKENTETVSPICSRSACTCALAPKRCIFLSFEVCHSATSSLQRTAGLQRELLSDGATEVFVRPENRHNERPTLRSTLAHQIRPSDCLLRHVGCCTRPDGVMKASSYPPTIRWENCRSPPHVARRTSRRLRRRIPRPEEKF